jgi:putative copper resistance protein D
MSPALEAAIAIVRALHFGALILLFGQFVFVFAIWRLGTLPPRFAATLAASLAVAAVTALGWLALEAVTMSGLPFAQALGRETLATVLRETLFGRVWLVRAALILGLCAAVASLARRGKPPGRAVQALAALLAAVLLATLAATGHAASERGLDRVAHLCADALHLLAAGAWLGALVPLATLLRRSSAAPNGDLAFAVQATRRFSSLGVAAMAALLLSGVVNACYTIRDAAMLLESQYGRLLLVKIAIFLVIIGFAASNRLIWTARLSRVSAALSDRAQALAILRRNAVFEVALGFAIVAIVGKLGITIPAAHMH